MELDQVRYFLALCKEKSFTRAARLCGISQPSLTNAIKRLDQKLGGEFFCRSLTETTLSERGLAVRPHLEQLAQCADNARRAAASNNRLRKNDNYNKSATAPRDFISKSGGMERDPDSASGNQVSHAIVLRENFYGRASDRYRAVAFV